LIENQTAHLALHLAEAVQSQRRWT